VERALIDCVAFDYGNVLSRPQDQVGIERLMQLTRLSTSEFVRRYTEPRLAYDRGVLTGTEYWATVLAGSRTEPTAELVAELIQTDVASWLGLDVRVVDWAQRLKAANVSLAILSNMPRDVLAVLRESRRDWLGAFAVTIFSCDVGEVKPERRIYERLLNALDLVGSRVLFIDDRDENVQAAAQVGLRAIQYRSFKALHDEIQAGFELPLP
jgi:putative hydrolase of the HAD superfamily